MEPSDAELVRLLPFAGDLLVGVLGLFGFGAVLLTGFGAHPDWFPRRFGGQRQAPPPSAPPAPPYGPGTDAEPA